MKKHTLILTFLFALACEGTPKENKAVAPAKKQETKTISATKSTKEIATPKPSKVSPYVKGAVSFVPKSNTKETEAGYLFVDIGRIVHNKGEISVLNKTKDTLIYLKNSRAYFRGNNFDVIEDEVSYYKDFKTLYYDPEFGIFILKCFGLDADGYYAVEVNKDTAYVHKEDHKDVLEFKSPEKYVYDGNYFFYYDENIILRNYPHEDSLEIAVEDYKRYWFKPFKVQGDWLELRDDKSCDIGDEALIAKGKVTGWLRWRKNDEIIIDFALRCW